MEVRPVGRREGDGVRNFHTVSGFAFPHPTKDVDYGREGHVSQGYPGMTYRQYLAAHAPPCPSDWEYTPDDPGPEPKKPDWYDPDRHKYRNQLTYEQGLEFDNYKAALYEWSQVKAIPREARWPWYWADQVLRAENYKPTTKDGVDEK